MLDKSCAHPEKFTLVHGINSSGLLFVKLVCIYKGKTVRMVRSGATVEINSHSAECLFHSSRLI